MGDPYVKKHVEERELTVILMVDASASGNFGSVNKFKGETAVELCALLAFSAIKNNDRVGLIIFTSDVELYIPPKKGKSCTACNQRTPVFQTCAIRNQYNRGTKIP